jgi:hypothetical protein
MSTRALQSSPGLIAPVTAVLLSLAGSAHAGILFSDGFAYANGNLAGNAGGTGWAAGSQWTGGSGATGNQVSGGSVRIASNASTTTRTLSTTYLTGITSYFVSFVFNASPFQGGTGQYAGVTLMLDSDASQSLFMGMPGDSGKLGFDWTNRGDGLYAATSATDYLVLFEIRAGASVASVLMYATTNLSMSGSALAATTALASLMNEPMFSFDTVQIAGGYTPGVISLAGLAMADNPTDAVAFTQSVVPGPAPLALGLIAGAFGGRGGPARRRRRDG